MAMMTGTAQASGERVLCETPYHGPKPHALSHDCLWPHLVAPAAASPFAAAMRDLDGHGNSRER